MKPPIRAIAVALTLLLVWAPSVDANGERGRRSERVEVIPYQQPIVGRPPTGMCIDCPTIVTGPRERFLSAEIHDAVSPTGYIELWIDKGDGIPIEYHATICGAIDSPIAVPPNTIFLLRVWAVPSDNCSGTSTTGSVTFKLSNRK